MVPHQGAPRLSAALLVALVVLLAEEVAGSLCASAGSSRRAAALECSDGTDEVSALQVQGLLSTRGNTMTGRYGGPTCRPVGCDTKGITPCSFDDMFGTACTKLDSLGGDSPAVIADCDAVTFMWTQQVSFTFGFCDTVAAEGRMHRPDSPPVMFGPGEETACTNHGLAKSACFWCDAAAEASDFQLPPPNFTTFIGGCTECPGAASLMKLECKRKDGGDASLAQSVASELASPQESVSKALVEKTSSEILDLTEGMPLCKLDCGPNNTGTTDHCHGPEVVDQACRRLGGRSQPLGQPISVWCQGITFSWTLNVTIVQHAPVATTLQFAQAESRALGDCPSEEAFGKAACEICDVALAPADIGTYTRLLVPFSAGVADCASYGVPDIAVELLCAGKSPR